tara:strand:- start:9 stop:692 length:684 start_codon:yes stop_codon:yes gene_type:complete
MAKKCPPGVLCIENFTILIIIIISVGIVYFMHKHYLFQSLLINQIQDRQFSSPQTNTTLRPPSYHTPHSTISKHHREHSPATIHITDTRQGDITSDPYVPPLKPAQHSIHSLRTRGGHLQKYKQIGYLKYSTGHHGKQHKRHHGRHHVNSMIPLFGRPSDTARNKWNYYTIHNGIKLQVNNQSRSCTSEQGCDELFSGDVVYVDGMDHTYQVTVYETSTFRYSPNVL